MSAQELALCIDWAAQEGWNPGLHDSTAFHATDPEGFLLGSVAGEPVGMVSAVRYGEDFGFIGFYLVRPQWRGRGYGLALWQAAMARLHGRLIGLDGVVAQQANYRKSGFVLAYNNLRMQGWAHARGPWHADLVDLADADLAPVLAYDSGLFPAARPDFLQLWLRAPGSIALGLQQQGQLRGYGVLRPCRMGYKVGPLFADDSAVAEALLNGLMSRVPAGVQVQWDMAADHGPARALAQAWDLQPVFETARMYTGAAPAYDRQRQFGITSFELG